MAQYRLTRPAWVIVAGDNLQRRLEAGEVVSTDQTPGSTWIPLDADAHAKVAALPFEILPNGLQARDRATGQVLVTRFNS